MGASRKHVVAAWPPGIEPGQLYALWCRLGLALLVASLAFSGRAERVRDEEPGLPRLSKAAERLGVGLEEAHGAVRWLLGEGERAGEDELAHLVGLLAALLTGLPELFRQALVLPLTRQATRMLRENDRGGGDIVMC
jgi:hypothetical protein